MDTVKQEHFDLDTFQSEVIQEVTALLHSPPQITRTPGQLSRNNQAALVRLLEKEMGQEGARKEVERIVKTGSIAPKTLAIINQRLDEIAEANIKANQILKQRDIRKAVCAALTSISSDVFDIAKIITPVLVTLVFTGTIVLPLSPLLFASVAVAVAKMGIATLCVEFKPGDK